MRAENDPRLLHNVFQERPDAISYPRIILKKGREILIGPFKREFWDLPETVRTALGKELEAQFALLFRKLNVGNTLDIVNRCVTPADVPLPPPVGLV